MSEPTDPFLPDASQTSNSDIDDNEQSLLFSGSKTGCRGHSRRQQTPIAILLGCCMVASWVLGMATLYTFRLVVPEPDVFHPETLASGTNLCDCGANIQEALQRGCVYDTLSTSWLPAYCRDADLTTKFDKSGDGPNGEWSYFADKDGTQRMSIEEIAALGDVGGHFWASRYWHRAHCVFYWQKQFRQRDTRIVMEERFDGLAHVEHCSRLLLHTTELEVLVPVPVLLNSSAADALRLSPEKTEHHLHNLSV